VLFIFVDDKGATPWTVELRQPVEKKIMQSLRWLEDKAQAYGIQLSFQHRSIPLGSTAALHAGCYINEVDICAGPVHSTWQNQVVTEFIGRSTSVACGWNELFDKAGLSIKATEGSAVIFCVRRYFPSIAFPYTKDQNVEFEKERAIIYDNGGETGQIYLDSEIAHEILHLYGAVELAPNKAPLLLSKHSSQFSDDVMHTPTQKAITSYCISNLTAYLIGWHRTMPEAWQTL
jgi:hypothetical protein